MAVAVDAERLLRGRKWDGDQFIAIDWTVCGPLNLSPAMHYQVIMTISMSQ